jgi:hypothetical protein
LLCGASLQDGIVIEPLQPISNPPLSRVRDLLFAAVSRKTCYASLVAVLPRESLLGGAYALLFPSQGKVCLHFCPLVRL